MANDRNDTGSSRRFDPLMLRTKRKRRRVIQTKKILFIYAVLFLTSSLCADSFKFIGGVNLARYSLGPVETSSQWKFSPGVCVGAGVEVDLTWNQTLAVEIDGLMIPKKVKRIRDPERPELDLSHGLSFIQIPVLVRFKFTSKSPFYVLGGGEFSLVLSHKVTGKNTNINLKESTKKIDYGVALGGGVEIRINKYQKIFLEARYHLGFVNLLKLPEPGESLKTSSLLLALGLKTH